MTNMTARNELMGLNLKSPPPLFPFVYENVAFVWKSVLY